MHREHVAAATLLLAIRVFLATTAAAQTIQLEPVVISALTSPIYVTHAGDGSGRLFIVEKPGRIKIWDGSQLLMPPFLDITALVGSSGNEQGLFSVAFHPSYQTNGFFYVDYTDTAGDTVVERYSVSADPNVADPQSGLLILAIPQPSTGHNGGQLSFGPDDGYLYIGTGDGGEPGDPNNYGQRIDTLLGKILRIDVDSGAPYTIPLDNPYVGIPGEDEIWATGLRNPWRFSFDRLTGDMFIGDVGHQSFEEIDLQPAASDGCENYGWRRMEGNACFNPATGCNPGEPTECNPTGALELPIIQYAQKSNPCDAVTGGYRYRGAGVPGLAGTYLYADYCRGEIFGARPVAGENGEVLWLSKLLFDAPFFLASFGEDEDGELYVVEIEPTARVYRIVGPTMSLEVQGLCPGPVTIGLSEAPPNTEVLVLAGGNANGFTKGGALCRGMRLTIGEPFQLPPTPVFVDDNGNGTASVTLAPGRCWMQAMATSTCELSNAVKVP